MHVPLSLVLGAFVSPAAPPLHDGDPKLLDLRPAYAGPGYRPGAAAGLHASGGGAFLGGGEGPGIDFPAQGVHLLSWITLQEMGASGGNDCWGYVSPSGREYALMGLTNGTAVVEISAPASPQIVALVPGPGSLWRDIKVFEHYAYAVTENDSGGIQVIDLEQVDAGVVTLAGTVMSGGTGKTHNVAIDEHSGFLYRTGGGNHGLRIYSLADPANPVFVGSWNDRYVHDAQVLTYTEGPYAGRQIAFCSSGFNGGSSQTRFEVLDVTNKQSIFVRDTVFYSNRAYSHQVWTSPDRQYAYLNDELDEDGSFPTTTYVFDISNLNDCFQAASFTNGNTAVGHNLYTRGELIYEANYRSGLRVFDATDPLAPQEVAWFDTWPDNDRANFNGLWSCFPYFPSGAVIGSDREKGLFVWWVGAPPVAVDYPAGLPERLDTLGATVPVSITESAPGELLAGSERLHWRSGGAWQSAPLASLGGGQYAAQFPELGCVEEVRWYVSARSSNGFEWRSPAGSPANAHRAWAAFSDLLLLEDDMEVDTGWSVDPLDTATQGRWERVDPIGTEAQPEHDHTPDPGTHCWVTGQFSDVGGGVTTLYTPVLRLASAVDPVVSYWRWYAKNLGLIHGDDPFEVYVTDDGGLEWVLVERLAGSGIEVEGDWYFHAFRLRDLVEATDSVRLKFVARDLNHPSIIEAAIDDFRIVDYRCDCDGNGVADDADIAAGAPDCNGNGVPDACDIAAGTSADADGDGVPDECQCFPESYCVGAPNSVGPGALIGAGGTPQLSQDDFTLLAAGAPPAQFGVFFYGSGEGQLPFGEGFLCVTGGAAGLFRLGPPQATDAAGGAERALDFDAPPASSGPGEIVPGSTWRFQFWYRDPAGGGSGFNLSDALRVPFCP